MMISAMIEEIIETGSKGKELLQDAFIIGIALGRQQLQDLKDFQSAIKWIQQVNDKIENSLVTPFYKEDQYNVFLADKNFVLFGFPSVLKIRSTTPPQKKQQENQQTPKNQTMQSQLYCNASPQQGKHLQTSEMCQLCNFFIDSKTQNQNQNQKVQLLKCKHIFHYLCLSISTFVQGNHCPICQEQLAEGFPQLLFDELPQQLKSCCPKIGCSNTFLFYGQDVFDCSSCKSQWCLKCKNKYHKNSDCTFEIDHFEMRLGQKFKYCCNCNQVLFLTELPTKDKQVALPPHCKEQ